MKVKWIKLITGLIIGSALCWQFIGAWQDSQTTDEAVHLTAGLSYWQTGDFHLNPEHPSLFKIIASFPLSLLPPAKLDVTPSWWNKTEWLVGAEYLYSSSAQQYYGDRFLLMNGRVPMIMIWLGLVLALTWWATKRWGDLPGLVTATAIAYDPNLLGHGHLVTNDVAMALAFWGSLWAIDRLLKRPGWANIIILSVVVGLAQLTKFSAIIIWPLVCLIPIIRIFYGSTNFDWRWWWRMILMMVLVGSLMTLFAYGGQAPRINDDPRIALLWQERQTIIDNGTIDQLPPVVKYLVKISDPSSTIGQWLKSVGEWRIPGYWYWRGLFSATSHNYYGHAAYLLGRASDTGWWYYFPVAIAVKTPFVLLLGLLGIFIRSLWTIAQGWRRRLSFKTIIPFDWWIWAIPPLLFLLWSMTSRINIGVRHIFPTYIFFPLALGSLAASLIKYRPVIGRWMVAATVTTCIIVPLLAWPNTIGYFNWLAGGTRGGYRILLDSNLDWNQDYLRLNKFLISHNWPTAHLALFGSIPTNIVFPQHTSVLTDADIAAGRQPSGIVVISAGQLYNLDGPFAWLRPYPPDWRIGSSIYVYDFR